MPGGQGGESGGNAKRSYGKDTLRPVTIKQLLSAQTTSPEADTFLIDDSEATQVTFVAQVRNISMQTTNVTYKMDDGTGIIEVKVWIDADTMNSMDEGADQKSKPVEQGYARVWGRLKDFNSKRHVGANYVRPISDYNEISYHLLEATAVHLHFTRGPLNQLQQANGGGASHTAGAATNGEASAGQGMGSNSSSALSGCDATAKKVYQVIRASPQFNEGLHVQDLAARAGLQVMQVQKACEDLTNAGLVYTTYDENTYALLQLD